MVFQGTVHFITQLKSITRRWFIMGSYYLYKVCTVSWMPPFSFLIMKLWIVCFCLWFLLLCFFQYYESFQRISYWLCGDFIFCVLFCFPFLSQGLLLSSLHVFPHCFGWISYSSDLPDWKPGAFSPFLSSLDAGRVPYLALSTAVAALHSFFPCYSFLIVETSVFPNFHGGFSFGDR